MALKSAEKEFIDTKESSKEFSNVELSKVAFDVSTQEGQLVLPHTVTIEGKPTLESYFTAEHRPIHVENNYSIIIITAGALCSSDASKSSNPTALRSDNLENILNVHIGKNSGSILLCSNIQLNFDVPPGKTHEKLKAKIQVSKDIPADQLQPIFDGKQFDSGQTNKNVEDGLTNRSEFCQATVLVPNTSQTTLCHQNCEKTDCKGS